MFSATNRPIILLFIIALHVKGILSSLTYNNGYVYPQPIKQFGVINPSNQLSEISTNKGAHYGVNFNHDQFAFPQNPVNNFLPEVESYIADGRVLKQYSVMENNIEDEIQRSLLAQPLLLQGLDTFVTNFGRIKENNLLPIQTNIPGRAQLIPPINNNGPVALGSGSLGYIRLPNGGIFLGSGSIGYISGQQRVADINNARSPKGLAPSPLFFGDTAPAINPTLSNPRVQLDPLFNARLNAGILPPPVRLNQPIRLNPVHLHPTQLLPVNY